MELLIVVVIIGLLVWRDRRAALKRRVERLEAHVQALQSELARLGAQPGPTVGAPEVASDSRQTRAAPPRSTEATHEAAPPDALPLPPTLAHRAGGRPAPPHSAARAGHGTHTRSEPGRPAAPPEAHAAREQRVPPPSNGDALGSALGAVIGFFSGSGAFARAGAIVLLFGVGLLLKYAADLGLITLRLRVGSVVVAALAAFAFGWRERHARPAFAAALQGAAFGALYVTVFVSMKFYALLGPTMGVSLLVLLGVLMGAAATAQRAQPLALLGALGAYLAPVLARGGGEGDGASPALLLFGYYTAVNVAALLVSARHAWQALPVLSFLMTFGVATAWGVLSYTPAQLPVAEVFLLVNFALFALYPLIPARAADGARPHAARFGLAATGPVVLLILQAALTGGDRVAMALTSLGLTVLYAALVAARAPLRDLHLALALGAATLAVPFVFGLNVTPAAWAVQGAALAWVAARARDARLLPWAVGVQALAGLMLLPGLLFAWTPAVAAQLFVLTVAGVVSGGALRPFRPAAAQALGGWGLAWWYLALLTTVTREAGPAEATARLVIAVALSAPPLVLLGRAWRLRALRLPALLPLPAVGVLVLAALADPPGQPWLALDVMGWLALVAALGAQLLLLESRRLGFPRDLRLPYHAAGTWVLTGVLTWAAVTWTNATFGPDLAFLTAGAVPLVVYLALVPLAPALPWVARAPAAYARLALLPLLGWCAAWWVGASGTSGQLNGLWPRPLLNPLDMLLLAVWVTGWLTYSGLRGGRGVFALPGRPRDDTLLLAGWALALGALWWLTFATLRAVSAVGRVDWTLPALFTSGAAQTAVTVAWALFGVTVVGWAALRGHREAWKAGAALIGVVTLKLFVVDLAGTSAPARILSFLVVGSLLMLLGYLAPVPPREPGADQPDPDQPGADQPGSPHVS